MITYYIVLKQSGYFVDVFLDPEEAEKCRAATHLSQALDGCADTRAYIKIITK